MLYAGTLGMAQGVQTLVDAAALAGPETVELTIVGDGPDRAALGALRLPHVHVHRAVAAADVPGLYAQCDVGAVILRDRPIFAGALPTKLFEVLAAGRPCVLAAPAGEATSLVDSGGCGVTVAPEDPVALADVWRSLHANPSQLVPLGERARATAALYDRERTIEQWHALLESVRALPVGRRSARAAAGRRPSG